MADHTLNWGILGTAKIGRKAVIPAIRASSNGTLVAVSSRDSSRARTFAEEQEIPEALGGYESLLDHDGIDAVYNPLPNSLHREWTIRAAEAGKHILCEKPLALNAEECREMRAAAEANGVKLMEAFMYRFHPRTEQVLEMVRAGDIGELRQIRSTFTFPLDHPEDIRWDPALGGGALMDVGCYCVNVSRTLAGAEPVEVRAMANFQDSGVDAQMAATLRFESGLLAYLDCALNMEHNQVYQVMGTEGHIRVLEAFRPESETLDIERFDAENHLTRVSAEVDDPYRRMVEHFAEAALKDLPLRFGPDDAERNMNVIRALYTSAKRGGTVVEVGEKARRSE
jgi:predicted dehydrogenase